MIEEFIKAWFSNLSVIRDKFSKRHPDGYKEIVKYVIEILHKSSNEDDNPDPNRIHEIDDGGYSGTLVYVIGASGYQPSRYWYVTVQYGSCSACDTFQGILKYDAADAAPTEKQIKAYMTLALHIVQELREMA